MRGLISLAQACQSLPFLPLPGEDGIRREFLFSVVRALPVLCVENQVMSDYVWSWLPLED